MSYNTQGEGNKEPNVAGRPVDCYPPRRMSTQELAHQVFKAAVPIHFASGSKSAVLN